MSWCARPATGWWISSFYGGSGKDRFDLGSVKSGLIDGGKGQDKLILAGDSGDFDFHLTDKASHAGTVAHGDEAQFDVVRVELFGFDDGQFTFDQLFQA